jgi:hypothetical protein
LSCTVLINPLTVFLESGPTTSKVCGLIRARFFRDLSKTKVQQAVSNAFIGIGGHIH